MRRYRKTVRRHRMGREDLIGYLRALKLMNELLPEHYEKASQEVEERWTTLRWLARAARSVPGTGAEKTLIALGMALARLDDRCGCSG